MKSIIFNRTFLAAATISLLSSPAFAQKSKVVDNIDLVFHNTTGMLQQIHYAPQPLNDHFSGQVFTEYLQQLDGGKRFFLKSDITRFKEFEWQLDDEMRGKMVQFYKVVNTTYKQRVKEAEGIITELLAQPYHFNADEYYNDSPKNTVYSKNAEDLKSRWKNYLKYQVLMHYDDLVEQKKKDSSNHLSDAQLEAKARETVQRIEKRNIENILKLTVDDEAFNLYINSIINLYDPHSSYFLPVDRREFQEGMSGIYYGIGALLQDQGGKVSIAELMIGGPAWKSGQVEKGDVLVKVQQGGSTEKTDLAGLAMSDVIKLTRGQKGTTVTITFRKNDGSLKDVTIQREALQMEDTFVKSAIINDSSKIGYISFPKFYTNFGDANGRSCAADMAVELEKLKAENVDGIVIDIRDNTGGSLGEVINMVGLFIKEGPVVQVKSAVGAPYVSTVKNNNVVYDGPLVVLVNEMSASAAEIFAAAIQDYHRGIVIGAASTYGKGSVQRGFGVGETKNTYSPESLDLGTIHITLQKYYRITGAATQLKGVAPDILLPGIYEPYKMQEKDNPTALKWDTIKPAPFALSMHSEEVSKTIAAAGTRIEKDSLLLSLRKNIHWLENRSSMHSMKLEKYRAEKKQLQQTIAAIRKQMVTSDSMTVVNTAYAQEDLKGKEQFRTDSNKAWLNSLRKDLFLSEAILVMQTWFRNKIVNS